MHEPFVLRPAIHYQCNVIIYINNNNNTFNLLSTFLTPKARKVTDSVSLGHFKLSLHKSLFRIDRFITIANQLSTVNDAVLNNSCIVD